MYKMCTDTELRYDWGEVMGANINKYIDSVLPGSLEPGERVFQNLVQIVK